MSAALMQMIVIRFLARNHHVIFFSSTRRSSSIANTKSSRYEDEEGLSLRAQKRKKSLEHFQKRHKVKETCSIDDKLSNRTKYYIQNGLRKVYPYHHTFMTYVKGRWVGKRIIDIYETEFRHEGINPADEIERGSVTVNGEKVPLDFILQDNMIIKYDYHRHEMPVLNEPIEVIEDTEELLVVNKPSSIPVHPCGSYRYNSVTMILELEHGYPNLRNLYRLDRLTSGVLMFMKTTSMARRLKRQLEGNELYKEYVCRVEGKFPDGDVVCNEPLSNMSYRIPVHMVDPKGKPSITTFTRLSYNGKTSIVKCVPHTGRTHQIRVHLQFLGYPVSNDPLYNRTAFGPCKGKGGIIEKTPEEIQDDILKTTSVGRWKIGLNPKYYQEFGHKIGLKRSSNVTSSLSESKSNSSDKIEKSKNTTKESVNIAELRKLQEIGKDSENVTEVSNYQCIKRVEIDNFSNSSADKTGLQKNCDIYKVGHVDNNIESGNGSDSDNRMEESPKVKKIFENSADENSDSGKSRKPALVQTVTDPEVIDDKLIVDEFCADCKYVFEDPKPADLTLYLHAVTYKGPDWKYSTTLPYWAAEDFDE